MPPRGPTYFTWRKGLEECPDPPGPGRPGRFRRVSRTYKDLRALTDWRYAAHIAALVLHNGGVVWQALQLCGRDLAPQLFG